MDWQTLLAGLALGIFGNLLTPAVQRFLVRFWLISVEGMGKIGKEGLVLRLKQLEEARVRVIRLKENPSELISELAAVLILMQMITWVLIAGGYFVLVNVDVNSIPKPVLAGVGGVIGGGTRFLIDVIVVWKDVENVRNYDAYLKRNRADSEKIQAILERGVAK